MVTSNQEDDYKLSEQAMEWLFALEDDDPQVQAQFRAWLYSSARHIEEFLFVSALYRRLDGVDRAGHIDVQRLIAEASSNVIALSDMRPAPESPSATAAVEKSNSGGAQRKWVIVVTAVSVLLMAIGAWRMGNGWQRYATSSGEQRILQLQDGSLLTMNTRSDVEVRFSETAREVRLLVGNATFKVARDTARPFRVYTGDSIIQAVGTEFHILRRAQATHVAVLEGKVRISKQAGDSSPEEIAGPVHADPALAVSLPTASFSPAQLSAGQEVRIGDDGEITSTPFGKRRLVFNDERLEDVAETFNFYNPHQRIRVQDSVAAERRLTGTFNADAPRSLIQILMAEPSLSIEEKGADLVIRAR